MDYRQVSYRPVYSDASEASPRMSRAHSNGSSSSAGSSALPLTPQYTPATAPRYSAPNGMPLSPLYTDNMSTYADTSYDSYGVSEYTLSPPADHYPYNNDYPSYDQEQYEESSYDCALADSTGHNTHSSHPMYASRPPDPGLNPNSGHGRHNSYSSSDPRSGIDSHGYHNCLFAGCEAKPFKRKADLDRHYAHRHCADDKKRKFHCDYHKCSRSREPFHRLDHCRDHYRDFHKEDLARKSGENDEWYADRNVVVSWWRCSKCLKRNKVQEGWQCGTGGCTGVCDGARRARRGYK